MRDLEKLKAECQIVNSFFALDCNNVMHLYDYHPWNNPPLVDYVTFKIKNLKNNNPAPNRARGYSVEFFVNALRSSIVPISKLDNMVGCIVPKSNAGELSIGMINVLATMVREIGFSNSINPLERVTTVQSAHSGGLRSIKIHKDSIRVVDNEQVYNKNVFLFDDVTTTGSSLEACKELLLEAGANQVFMIAFGKTV